MARIKVIEHGYFFKNNKLKTKCACGCVYLTHKKKVQVKDGTNQIGELRYEISEYFATFCPECGRYNRQNIEQLRKEKECKVTLEGKHEKLWRIL